MIITLAIIVFGLHLFLLAYKFRELRKENEKIWEAIDKINDGSYLIKEKKEE